MSAQAAIARRRRLAAIVAVSVAFAGAGTAVAAPASHTIVIDGSRFVPPELTVRVGDTVRWINKDPFPHTATASDRAFDSGNIGPGRSWKFTARTAGDFAYICRVHPTMTATLHVKAPGGR